MSQEDTIHLGQWFHPLLNPPAFEDLARIVSDATDLELRRKNHRVGNQFNDVSSKLELLRFHAKSGMDRIAFGRSQVASMLADLTADLETNVEQHRRVAVGNLVIEFRDHVLVAHLEGALIQAKCLLDSLAQFYSLAFRRSIKTFSDKGTNVLRDLRHFGAKYARDAEQLTSWVNAAKTTWADEAINYRDELVHFGQLREFRCLYLPLTIATRYRPADVQNSIMPSKRPTEDYFAHLVDRTHAFAAAWLTLAFRRLLADEGK